MDKCYQIIVTYTNGAIITIDVPKNYYSTKYIKKPKEKLYKLFIQDYKNFVAALNSNTNSIVSVDRYFSFSKAIISSRDVLSVDLKQIPDDQTPKNNIMVDSLERTNNMNNDSYLNFDKTSLKNILNKLENTNLIENLNTLVKNMNGIISKNSVEINIKSESRKKASQTTSKALKGEESILNDANVSNKTIIE